MFSLYRSNFPLFSFYSVSSLFCPFITQSAPISAHICFDLAHFTPFCSIWLGYILFDLSLFRFMHFLSPMYCIRSDLLSPISLCSGGYSSAIFCSALVHIISSGFFHSLPFLFCSTAGTFCPFSYFPFPGSVQSGSLLSCTSCLLSRPFTLYSTRYVGCVGHFLRGCTP